jgi:hypothetical protein
MPFIAACTCCGRQSHVPDCARGGLVWCVNCSSFYLVPAKAKTRVLPVQMPQHAKPFRTACTHCGRESCVPGRARGQSAWCPRCCQIFTVTKKSSDVSIAALVSGNAAEPTPWEETPSVAEPAPGVQDTAVTPATVPAQAPLQQQQHQPAARKHATRPRPSRRLKDDDDSPRTQDPLGLGAICLGSIAFLCGALSWLCVLLVPISMLGLVIGLASLVRVVCYRQVRPTFAVAGTAVCAVVMFLGLVFPASLGPTYRAYKFDRPIPAYSPRPGSPQKSLTF